MEWNGDQLLKRVFLRVAYDGTRYHGYQIQETATTIEGELHKAICDLTGEDVELIGGSRTDAGVHAKANVCVFDTESPIPGDRFIFALNQRLPEDIVILESKEVEADFHPRHCDSVKTYEYRIHCSELPDPIKRLYFAQTSYKLDTAKMQEASKYIIGEHDFSSFCASGAQVDSKIRTVYSCEVSMVTTDEKDAVDDWGYDIVIKVSGNGFLYNMVRIIAGTLMEVGRGHIEPIKVRDIIEAKDRACAGPTAPACGLTLWSYEFV